MGLAPKLKGLPANYFITEKPIETPNSRLYTGFDIETNQSVMVKQCKYTDDFCREVNASTRIFERGVNGLFVPILNSFPEEKYLVMPYIEGGSLWDYRKSRKGLSLIEALPLTVQIGRALEYLHTLGIIHNDLKSGNVLLSSSNTAPQATLTAKLTDLGSCYGIPDLEPWSGAGTREYMAPEKLRDAYLVTHLVDIYSLGLIIHEILTNSLLYEFPKERRKELESDQEKLEEESLQFHLEKRKEPIPPHEKIPEKVFNVIQKSCQDNPADRYQKASEMVQDLESAVAESLRLQDLEEIF
ncbi:MAG TPA: protein kinase [Candidatus Nanoarchaeia archaeon]|nr:protein kinase [Candidatus Nanoarchaeia archaeon]